MKATAFHASLAGSEPPPDLDPAALALWWYGRGDWERAHALAMAQDDAQGAAIHALLHRHEGDMANARYWYRRAGREPATAPLRAEWEALVAEVLEN